MISTLRKTNHFDNLPMDVHLYVLEYVIDELSYAHKKKFVRHNDELQESLKDIWLDNHYGHPDSQIHRFLLHMKGMNISSYWLTPFDNSTMYNI